MPDLSKPTQAWDLVWDADWVTAVTFLGDSRLVAAGNNLGEILLWELPKEATKELPSPVAKLVGHSNVISHLASPDGKSLISSSYDHTIRYWEIPAKLPAASETVALNASAVAEAIRRKSAKPPGPIEVKVSKLEATRTLTDHKEWIVGMQLSRDGKTMITGDDSGQVFVWDRAAGTVQKQWKVKGWAYAVALSPDLKQACISERYPLVFDAGRHAGIQLWDVKEGKVMRNLSALFKDQQLCSAAYSPDGKLLAVGRGGEANGPNGKVTLLDPVEGKVVRELTPGHVDGLTDLAFHPDGKHLASSGRDTLVRIWDTSTGKMISEAGKGRGGQFKDWICAVSWSAGGAWLAGADMAGAVQVWSFGGAK